MKMDKNLAVATGLIIIALLVCGLECWYVSVPRTDHTSYGSADDPINAVPNAVVYEDIQFPIDSYNQEIFVNFTSSAGNFTLIMLPESKAQNYRNDARYSAIFEVVNVSSLSETVNLTKPVYELINLLLVSTVGELSFSGEVVIHCDVSYRWVAPSFFLLIMITLVVVATPDIWKKIRKG